MPAKYAPRVVRALASGSVKNDGVDRRVDFHQHLWPETFIAALSARTEPPRLRGPVLELAHEEPDAVDLAAHDVDSRLTHLDRDGIDAAVISLSPALGIHVLP